MYTELVDFLKHLSGIVALTLVPVIVVAFVSMPLNLGHHPGEAAPQTGQLDRHMT